MCNYMSVFKIESNVSFEVSLSTNNTYVNEFLNPKKPY